MAAIDNVCNPISTKELERRWAAVRAAMADRGIDVLLMQNSNSFHGGYVKWFTDIPAMVGGYSAVMFPADDRMTAFRHGPERSIDVAEDDPVNRGVKKIRLAPTFAAVDYTKHYHSQQVTEELRPYADRTIGIVGTTSMAYAFLDHIKSGSLANAKFVDATEMVDEIKGIKSGEEIEFIKKAAAMQDIAMNEVMNNIKPGDKQFEVVALAQYTGQKLGSEQGLFNAGSGPIGASFSKGGRHMQDGEIKDGDYFSLLIENNGPGGMYTEIGRTCVFGKATQEMHDEFAFTLEAQRFTLDLIKPGAAPAEVFAKYNDFMRENGKPEEQRLHSHGQGYDLVERPMIFPDETMKIAANMNIVCHPSYSTETAYTWICDNYLVGEDGIGESIHQTPQKIYEL